MSIMVQVIGIHQYINCAKYQIFISRHALLPIFSILVKFCNFIIGVAFPSLNAGIRMLRVACYMLNVECYMLHVCGMLHGMLHDMLHVTCCMACRMLHGMSHVA